MRSNLTLLDDEVANMKSKLVVPLSLAASVAALFFFQIDFVSSQLSFGGGTAGAGAQLAGLSATQAAFFTAGAADFAEVENVPDGLGPRMNLDSCGGCHIQPALGGTSPFVNPQVAFAAKDGGTDRVPTFIAANGPVRRERLYARATGLRATAREPQRDLPDSHPDVRGRADRTDSGCRDRGEP